MDDIQSNRPDNLGNISDSGLILLKAKRVLAAIRHETVPAHIRDHAVQRPKMVTPPNLAAVPLGKVECIEATRFSDRHFRHRGYDKAEQHVRAVLHQRHETELRERALAAARTRIAKAGTVLVRVGHIQA